MITGRVEFGDCFFFFSLFLIDHILVTRICRIKMLYRVHSPLLKRNIINNNHIGTRTNDGPGNNLQKDANINT